MLKDVSYCVWDAFQVVFVYFMIPETSGRTLEELTFCKCAGTLRDISYDITSIVYEGDQDALKHAEGEVLHEHRDTGTYGTMEGDPAVTSRCRTDQRAADSCWALGAT